MNRMKSFSQNKYFLLSILVIIYFGSEINAQQTFVESHYFQSNILTQKVNYSIILPENYYKTSEKYPVIYLLHGIGGNGESWIKRCNFNILIDSLKDCNLISDLIYIMPDAHNSYYIDNYNRSFCYESFFINEFIPFIDSNYRTIPSASDRTIMGLSMGGFGAVILGIKHPDVFGTIISLSGALRDSASFVNLSEEKYKKYFSDVYGPELKSESRITSHWKLNSPYYLIDSTYAYALKNINWYFDCASGDSLYPVNEAFHKLLMNNNIPHEFHSRPGNHNWAYWYHSSANALIYNSFLLRQKNKAIQR
jgi:enterochelin esterase-like enzyme